VNWVVFVVNLISQLPIEKIFIRPPDRVKALQDLEKNLKAGAASQQTDAKKQSLLERLNREAGEAKEYMRGGS